MRKFAATIATAALTLGLAACGAPKDEPAAPASGDASASASASEAASGEVGASALPATPAAASAAPAAAMAAAGARPAAFAQCAACHAVEKGKHGIGPSLAGVYGTKSADIPGYAFSDAMKKANLTWDDATLDTYLAGPMKLVPGTKMTFAGLTDPAARQAVIAYLKTLK